MIENINQTVGHYPYKLDEDPTVVRCAFGTQFNLLVASLPIPNEVKPSVLDNLKNYYIDIERLGLREWLLRKDGDPRANLYYHDLNHFWQCGFDGIILARAVRASQKPIASHLSPEGAIATAIAALIHDIGEITASPLLDYVADRQIYYTEDSYKTLAEHKPIHVYASMDYAKKLLQRFPFPEPLNHQKISELVNQGIHNTLFPWKQEHSDQRRSMLQFATPEQWREAMIVRLIVQLADLGGQSIRVDQIPEGLKRLRAEENEIKAGEGTRLLGTDEKLIGNTRWFSEHILIPTVGINANALLGRHNPFLDRFIEVLEKPQCQEEKLSAILRTIPEHKPKLYFLKAA